MSPIIILIISIILVVAGILACKLHAFLALLLAALVAAFLTPESALDTYALDEAEKSFVTLYGANPDDPSSEQQYDQVKKSYVEKHVAQFKKKSAMSRVAEGFGR